MIETVLITGAGRRIGKAIALSLGREGWTVVVHYNRSREDAAETVAEIVKGGGQAVAIQADLAIEEQSASLIERARAAVGPIGALINNASRFDYDAWDTATRQSWDAHMEANLRAPFVLTQGFARQLPQGAEGCVINVLDQRVWNLTPNYVSYTVSKVGLWALTQTMAQALSPRIRVNAVGPGPTLPNARQTPEQFAEQCAGVPLGRGASPEDVCAAIRYLLGARSVTGQMIAVDGGQHLGWTRASSGDPTQD